MKFSLSKTIEILTFVGLICGLGFQYMELNDSKKEINKLDKIVSNIQENANKLHKEEIERIKSITEEIKSSSEMYQTLLTINDSDNKANFKNFENLILSLKLSNEAVITGNSEWLSYANNLQVALLRKMNIFQEWQLEINKISERHNEKVSVYLNDAPTNEETVKTLQSYNEEFLRDVSMVNGRYSERIKPYVGMLEKQQRLVIDTLSKT
ncbi:hypothetical protein EDB14_2833 [Vibrio crassostreae]|uniref:hypothetical protein n=1 Tax=Vibrio crassostreae TaxID=246167 RepID=UPI000F4E8BAC|nr:hypothetical protein [Vibrio crassostreae]RPF04857.1 hypothetical protein EDB14_2833 [Vibrio crassostreae]